MIIDAALCIQSGTLYLYLATNPWPCCHVLALTLPGCAHNMDSGTGALVHLRWRREQSLSNLHYLGLGRDICLWDLVEVARV